MSCPICAKESDPKYRPFCSRRCADVDLGRWLKGSYAIPSDDSENRESMTDARSDTAAEEGRLH